MGTLRRGLVRGAAPAILAAALVAAAPGGAALAGDPSPRKLAASSDPEERWQAAELLGRDPSPQSARLLAKLLADEDPRVRDTALEQCDRFRSEDAASALVASLPPRIETAARVTVVAGVGRTRTRAALETLLRSARSDTEGEVRAEATEGLARFPLCAEIETALTLSARDKDAVVRACAAYAASRVGGASNRALVARAYGDRDDGVRAAGLAAMDDDAQELHVLGAVVDPSWRVRVQCVEVALALRSVQAIDALVELVPDPSDRVAGAAVTALQRLSGKDYARDPKLWSDWWRRARETWRRPDGTLAPERAPGEDRGRTRAFMGVLFDGDATAFVIDASGSMTYPVSPSQTRFELVRKELDATLDALPDGHRVNVILFSDRVRAWSDALRPLSARTRAAATTFAGAESPGGNTNLLGALLRALSDDDVESICLLSDGAPTVGDAVATFRVGELVRRVNRRRKVAIHTVGIGVEQESERGFLLGLAADSGGRCELK